LQVGAVFIVINGALGVGKTQTGWRIVESLNRAALVDIDYIAAVAPFDHQIDRDRQYAYESAAAVAAHHVQNGYEPVVVTWVFETQEQLTSLRERFSDFGELHAFRLTCSLARLEERIRHRGHEDVQRELVRARELHAILERAGKFGELGIPIETDDRAIDEVASTVIRHLGLNESAMP
jgi:broad-specificity NMP kinase